MPRRKASCSTTSARPTGRMSTRTRSEPAEIRKPPMPRPVIITCALTGGGDTTGVSRFVPITPAQIAEEALAAQAAGAAIVHIHVRDPATGKPSRELSLYREVVERIRGS